MAHGYILGTDNRLVTASELTSYPNAFVGSAPENSKYIIKDDLKSVWRTEEINDSTVPGSRILREKDVYSPANGYMYKYTTQNDNTWRVSVMLFEDRYVVWRNLMMDQVTTRVNGTAREIDQINAKVKNVCHQLWTYGKLRESSDGDLHIYSANSNYYYDTNVRRCLLYAYEESPWEQGYNPIFFKNTYFKANTDNTHIVDWQGAIIALMCFQTVWPTVNTNGSGGFHPDVTHVRFYDLGPDVEYNQSVFNNGNSSIYNNSNYIKFSTDYIVKDESWHDSSCNYTAYVNSGANIYGPFIWMWQKVFLDRVYSFIYK